MRQVFSATFLTTSQQRVDRASSSGIAFRPFKDSITIVRNKEAALSCSICGQNNLSNFKENSQPNQSITPQQ
jgi:hypothetical protein